MKKGSQVRKNRGFGKFKGFSLLEMVIVMGIIAILLGGAIYMMGGLTGQAEIQRAKTDIQSLSTALETYKINAGNYPTQSQGLKALVERPSSPPIPRPYKAIMDEVPKDPWGNEYRYRFPGSVDKSKPEVFSVGEDGQADTDDDITNQQKK